MEWEVAGQKFWWRPVKEDDLSSMIEAQDRSYAEEFRETLDAFRFRVTHCPQGLWIAETVMPASSSPTSHVPIRSSITGRQVVGYTIFHPWIWGRAFPHIHGQLDWPGHEKFDCIYHHDWCIIPEYQGKAVGLNRRMDLLATQMAQRLGFERVIAVSLHGSTPTTEHRGFRPCPGLQHLAGEDYGPKRLVLERTVPVPSDGAWGERQSREQKAQRGSHEEERRGITEDEDEDEPVVQSSPVISRRPLVPLLIQIGIVSILAYRFWGSSIWSRR